MVHLVDTNVLLRRAQTAHPMSAVAGRALEALRERGDSPCIAPQNVAESWSVATRPAKVNGLGLSPAQTELQVDQIERLFRLLPDTPELYSTWRKLVVQHNVSRRQVHDARLAAWMLIHGVRSILTFNGADFARYSDISSLDPAAV